VYTPTPSFWRKPEGRIGMAVLGLLGAAGGTFFWTTLLPALGPLLENDFTAAGLCVALAGVLWAATTAGIRSRSRARFQVLMRALHGKLVKPDPIGDLRKLAAGLEMDIAQLSTQVDNLGDKIESIGLDIDANVREADQALRDVNSGRSKAGKLFLKSRQALRLQKSNQTLSELLTRMKQLHEQLAKMRDDSEAVRQDIEAEIRVREKERVALIAGTSAIRAATRSFGGDLERQLAFDRATESLADDFSERIGRIRAFVETSQSFIDGVDIQNGIYRGEALDLLEQWKANGDGVLAGNGTDADAGPDIPEPIDVRAYEVRQPSTDPGARPRHKIREN